MKKSFVSLVKADLSAIEEHMRLEIEAMEQGGWALASVSGPTLGQQETFVLLMFQRDDRSA